MFDFTGSIEFMSQSKFIPLFEVTFSFTYLNLIRAKKYR